jgi:CBS domain-containing protein
MASPHARDTQGGEMKVSKIMTADPRTCAPSTTLADAAKLLWEGDCGVLPVVYGGKLIGVVTDRDMFIALATRDTRASQLTVGEACSKNVWTCEPEDNVTTALATMKEHRVRRLPVVGFGGTVLGVLSMNDVLLAAGPRGGIQAEEVLTTLQAICAHHHPVPTVVSA